MPKPVTLNLVQKPFGDGYLWIDTFQGNEQTGPFGRGNSPTEAIKKLVDDRRGDADPATGFRLASLHRVTGAPVMKTFIVRARAPDGRRRMLMFKSDWYAVPLSIAYAGALAVCFLISVGAL